MEAPVNYSWRDQTVAERTLVTVRWGRGRVRSFVRSGRCFDPCPALRASESESLAGLGSVGCFFALLPAVSRSHGGRVDASRFIRVARWVWTPVPSDECRGGIREYDWEGSLTVIRRGPAAVGPITVRFG
jgi:hypothetical protein